MPLRFSSLRRGLLLVAVNHEKGEPHKHSEALGFSIPAIMSINFDFVASSIFLLTNFATIILLWKIATPWQWEFRSTSIMRSSLRSISSRRYSRGSRQLARARISFRDNPLNARLRREPGYGSSL